MAYSLRHVTAAGVIASAAILILLSGLLPSGAGVPPHRPAVSPRPAVVTLTVEPSSLQLNGPRAVAHYLVTARLSDGSLLDVTDKAEMASPSIRVRMEAKGTLRPAQDGAATLRFTYGDRTAAAKVTVRGAKAPTPIRFSNEVVPVLTRAGCNQGACHGAQYGKGGFKLSLLGFDPAADYLAIARQARGRRISLADPTHSLILLKPTMAVRHGGGRRLEPGSAPYDTIVRWLQDGAPAPDPKSPTVDRIDVYPSERMLSPDGGPQRLVVVATYTDGTTRDVTDQARFNTLNDAVVACTPEGVATPAGRGQTAVMVRYAGRAAVATFLIPFGKMVPNFRGGGQAGRIDALVAKKQRQLGLIPSPLCDDRTFIRRVFFDLIGTAPTPQEIAGFLAEDAPDKRAHLVDRLLTRPEYADYWSLKWGDLLRSNRGPLGLKGMWSFTNWIHDQFQQNRPIDQFVHDLILAQGSTFTNGPSNYYRVVSDPKDLAETTSQVFLGVRLQCARCHHHPFERWSQADYYQFAAFFARVGLKGSDEFGLFGNEQVVRINDGGEVTHPKTGAVMHPTPLGVQLASLPGGKAPDPDAGGDRRRALADWLTSKNNRLFARNIANRYWGYLFGKGIVNPIDDQRVTNPPSNPELLDALADELVRGNYDLKHLLRVICTSQTYQRSSEATPQNARDDLFFTHYLPRRLPAETLLDAIDFACGTREKYPDLPLGTRAIQLPDPQVGSDFLDMFGRPQRVIDCECERVSEPNLGQALSLMNGDLVNHKASDEHGRIARLIAAGRSDASIINELYTVTLGRDPSPWERNQILGVLAFSPAADRASIFQDVLVTLLNSKEFLFNH
ncbi:MAG TPA: DUF1549 and DUF1553 domain-containing protein [Chthonomonadaceae bacterium]|nr:DUF1549 and DUF1553 domain-containing protein [Chthonomonadaceae bacterium]